MIAFSHGKLEGIVSADVTTLKKEGQASSLTWVPTQGDTKWVEFFVVFDIDPLPGGSSHISNIAIHKS